MSLQAEERKKLSKKDLLTAFKADMKAADNLRLEQVAQVEQWRKEYNGEKYGNEVKGKSELVSRDIKRQDEWQHASVKDPFVSDTDIVKCSPVTFEDRTAAEQNELVLNYQFARQFPRYKFMTDVIKLFYKEGTVIVKTGWQYEDEEEEVELPKYAINPLTMEPQVIGYAMTKKLKVLVNKPDATICRIEDCYLDPTAEGDPQKARFFIHRYESDLSTLRKAGKYKNLKKLAMDVAGVSEYDSDFDPTDDTEFTFEDQPRKKIVVYEYWGYYDMNGDGIAEPIVCTWVGDIIIQLESNPFPDQEIPVLVVANNSIPFKQYGEANAELVGDNQKISTAIKRGILDNMANSNNAQKGIRVSSLDAMNKKRFLNGKNFEFNGSAADFYEGSYNPIPQSVFQVMEMVNNETESMLGVKSFSGGISGQSLGGTATAARGALDAVSVRRLDIVRNLAENLIKPLMRKWTSYNSEFLQPEEIIRITNDEFVPIKRDDLAGEIDIHIDVSTSEDNAAKAQELAFLLQTLGQTMDPGMMKILTVQIAKLNKMPDLAKAMEEYEPQPDPITEEMRKWELRKLISEVKERESRALENQVDMDAKSAKADLDRAKTANLQSDTDNKDLDFTRKAQGIEHQEKMDQQNAAGRTSLAGMGLNNMSKERIKAAELANRPQGG
jgi:hypothetical protein